MKVRYKQTALGAAWAILQPLLTMLVFTLFFGKFANLPSEGLPYPLFAYAGLLPWTFFSNGITNSGNSLVGSANLVTKVYFPRMNLKWTPKSRPLNPNFKLWSRPSSAQLEPLSAP